MTTPTTDLEREVLDAFHAVAGDLADAARACGEPDRIHVSDLADAISGFLACRGIRAEFPELKKIIRRHLTASPRSQYVNL